MYQRVTIALVIILAVAGIAVGFAWPRIKSADVLELAGVVEIQEVRLASKVGGRIEKVLVEESEMVPAGQPLVLIESRELKAQRDELVAKLSSAKSALEKAENGPRPEEKAAAAAAVAAATAKLDRLNNGARPEEIDAARAELAAADADMQAKQKEWRRLAELFAKGNTSESAHDAAKQAFDVAKAKADAARAQFNLITAPPRHEDVAEAKAEIGRLKAQHELLEAGTREEEKAMARAEVESIEAEIAHLDIQIEETTVRAIEPCRIEVIILRAGDMATAGQPVVRVLRMQDRWVKAYVPEVELPHVRLGQQVTVRTDSSAVKPLTGTIVHINEISEFTPRNVQTLDGRKHQVFGIKIRVDDPEGVLKSGMAAQVTLPRK